MRNTLFVVALVAQILATLPAQAQLPTAAGKQITMSNSAWKIFIPNNYYQRSNNVADVLVHFHGDPQTFWNNAKYANLNTIIVTVNYSGLSSAYSTPFSNASLFQSLLNEALDKVTDEAFIPDTLQWDKIAVSSFSAGYGAVREILKSPTYRNDIDVLLAADSLYATTAGDGTPLDSQMVDYKTFATLAKNGSKTFMFTHSQVPTYTYESTQEIGDELMQFLGISATAINTNGLGTLNFNRTAQTGNFRLWGATGEDGDSHLEHLRYIGEFLEDLPLAKAPEQGDYTANGAIDAADYVLWRKTLGSTTNLWANGDATGTSAYVINEADYLAWRKSYVEAPAAGGAQSSLAVPEPRGDVSSVTDVCCRIRRHCRPVAPAGDSDDRRLTRILRMATGSLWPQSARCPLLRLRAGCSLPSIGFLLTSATFVFRTSKPFT